MAARNTGRSRRELCMLKLPDDFLRVSTGSPRNLASFPISPSTVSNDEQAAIALHHQLNSVGALRGHSYANANNYVGRLLISIMQAKLVKNYGLLFRMDPFVRLHVGHTIYETPTAVSGGKNPKWNKSIQCFLPRGVTEIYLEIYDECSFSASDELVASANIPLPLEKLVDKKETVESWFDLSGKQGKDKEGQILIVFSLVPFPQGQQPPPQTGPRGSPMQPSDSSNPESGGVQIPPQRVVPEEEKVETMKMFREMFPGMNPDIVKSVYTESGFDRDETVNTLLVLSSSSSSEGGAVGGVSPAPPTTSLFN